MNWRALWQNPWFQLCLLVALLSGGTMAYNHFKQANPPNKSAEAPQPTPVRTASARQSRANAPSSPSPSPVVGTLKPKHRGQWILDAAGAADADSTDLPAIAASLTDGDVVVVRKGLYKGNCEISHNVDFIGPLPNDGAAIFRFEDGRHPGLFVSKGKVVLERLSIEMIAEAKTAAIYVLGSLVMKDCFVSTHGSLAVIAKESGLFQAEDSQFRASDTGTCLVCLGFACGWASQCTFTEARWGATAEGSAQEHFSNCTFYKLGVKGSGCTITAKGKEAFIAADFCKFTENNAGAFADQGGNLSITESSFRESGVGDEPGNTTWGTVAATAEGKVFLKDDSFFDNKQGVTATVSGTLELDHVRMERTGLKTENGNIATFSNSIIALRKGTVTATHCTIAGSIRSGFLADSGAHLTVTNTAVTDSEISGFMLGFSKPDSVEADLDNVQILGAREYAIWASDGATVTVKNSKISDAKTGGVRADDAGTDLTMTRTTVTQCSGTAVLGLSGATITGIDCTIQKNERGVAAGTSDDSSKAASVSLSGCTVEDNAVFGVAAFRGATLKVKGGALRNNKTVQEGFLRVDP